MDINSQTVGIVVPTLGNREDFLRIALDSIRQSSNTFVVIVAPSNVDLTKFSDLFDLRVDDPAQGLPEAINKGFEALPSQINLINWLGDDDFLEPKAMDVARELINSNQKLVAVFGKCNYVDSTGQILFTNRSGQLAVPLLKFGPNLIPQPGMLFRKDAFSAVGGLNGKYGLAFDLDLFLKLGSLGKLKYINRTVSNFRWHPTSLSVELRKDAVLEASNIRKSHLPKFFIPFSFIWEIPVIYLTLKSGQQLSKRLKKEK